MQNDELLILFKQFVILLSINSTKDVESQSEVC